MKSRIPCLRLGKEFPSRLFDHLLDDLSETLDANDVSRLRAGNDVSQVLLPPQCIEAGEVSDTAYKAAAHHLLRNLLRKFQNGKPAATLKVDAAEKFTACEQNCKLYNDDYRNDRFDSERPSRVLPEKIVRRARAFISRVLGNQLPTAEELTRESRFGPGSNVDVMYRHRNVYYKYLRWPYSVSTSARDLAFQAIRADERWWGALENSLRKEAGVEPWRILDLEKTKSVILTDCNFNRVTFVPKTSTSVRTIAIEPRMSVYLQLGVDGFIRNRLASNGIDLNDQSRNRLLAMEGSLGDHLATIDLSSASDSISLSLVKELLPAPWYDYLCSIRSRYGFMPNGDLIEYQKISSMGNGFTFALESLIFASIVLACTPYRRWHYVSVYGDDIICPIEDFDLVTEALHLAGFTVNDKKSFSRGPFRESCGCDAWLGIDITPVYLRRTPQTLPDLIGLFNRLKKWFRLNNPQCIIDPDLFDNTKVGKFLRSRIPTGYDYQGPAFAEYPDAWLHHYAFVARETVTKLVGVFRTSERQYPGTLDFSKLMTDLRPVKERDPWEDDTVDLGTCFAIPGKPGVTNRRVEVFTPQLV